MQNLEAQESSTPNISFKTFVLSRLIYWTYRLLTLTWRLEIKADPKTQSLLQESRPVIFAHWHGHELAIIQLVTRFRIATMTSTSKDGSLVDYVIHRLGGATSRGSATRGAVQALKGLVRICKSGKYNPSMAVDGPKGPIYKVKPGVFTLSRLSGFPIVTVAAAASKQKTFSRSWNKTFIPLPFSRVVVVFGPPLEPLGKEQDPKDQSLALHLEEQLHHSGRVALNSI